MADAARACLWSRVAARVLLEVTSFEARDGERPLRRRARGRLGRLDDAADDAGGAGDVPLEPAHALAVRRAEDQGRGRRRPARPLRRSGPRSTGTTPTSSSPSTSRATRRRSTSTWEEPRSTSAAGGATAGAAPLRETLAAAVLRLSGWDRASAAASTRCAARGRSPSRRRRGRAALRPGLSRARFGFERWADHDEAAKAAMRELEAASPRRAPARRPRRPDYPRERRRRARPGADRARTRATRGSSVRHRAARRAIDSRRSCRRASS